MRTAIILGALLIAMGAFCFYSGYSQEGERLQEDLDRLQELGSRSLPERAPKWRCDALMKFQCSMKGCEKVPVSAWIKVDFQARRYERCDSKGCDAHQMTYSTAGIYTTVLPGLGTFLKAVNDGSEFADIASLGTGIFASFGRCIPQS